MPEIVLVAGRSLLLTDVFRGARIGRLMDRVIASLQRRVEEESDAALARQMHFPTRWDPFFTDTMTLAVRLSPRAVHARPDPLTAFACSRANRARLNTHVNATAPSMPAIRLTSTAGVQRTLPSLMT